jgi:hypothetical protein
MRQTFAHHFSSQLKIDEDHIINHGSALARFHVRMSRRKSFWHVCARSIFYLEKSRSKKSHGDWEFATMLQCRISFFKDLVGSDGQPSSGLQQSIEISGAENIDRAVEEAKRRYERLCRVPLWSLYADRLELENDGQRISYRPTPDEIALIPIPGRRKAVSEFAIGR